MEIDGVYLIAVLKTVAVKGVPADAGFLYDKTALPVQKMKERFCLLDKSIR
jgi:hypothetical protein